MAHVVSSALALIMLSLILSMAPKADSQISCTRVNSFVRPCVTWANTRDNFQACCRGIVGLRAAVRTQADPRAACRCLVLLVQRSIPVNNRPRFSSAPRVCRASNVPYWWRPGINCNRIPSNT